MLQEFAAKLGLDQELFAPDLESGRAREVVLAKARLGQEQYRVRGTPTLMLGPALNCVLPSPYREYARMESWA